MNKDIKLHKTLVKPQYGNVNFSMVFIVREAIAGNRTSSELEGNHLLKECEYWDFVDRLYHQKNCTLRKEEGREDT